MDQLAPRVPVKQEDVLSAALLAMTDDTYLNYFPLPMQEQYRQLGKTAVDDAGSQMRVMLEGLAHGIAAELRKQGYSK